MTSSQQPVLVTGASSGIGRETALRLAQRGHQVIVAARRMARLEEMAHQNANLIPRRVDLADPDDTEAFCRYLSDLPHPVAVLVNNAGYATRGVVEDVGIQEIRRLFEVNFFALIRLTQACLPGMRRMRRGRIINVSSIVGKFPFAGSGVYAASKYAVEGITDALRVELAPFGIDVVTIRPGVIATEFQQAAEKRTADVVADQLPDYQPFHQSVKEAVATIFAGRTGSSPELIADMIVEAVSAETPRAVYTAGTLSEEFLDKRAELDDDAFFRFLLAKFGLTGRMF